MIRSVEFDLVTKSEANQRFASMKGMFAKSGRTQKQRAAVRDVLAAHHTAPRLFVTATADPIPDDARAVTMAQVQASLGATKPNRIIVRLTRITPGELDDDNLRGALKAVRDAVAAWIGTNDRDPLISWEYGQERAAQHVYRVRIELTDLGPGEPRRVVLAETGSEARAAKSRVKRLTTKAAKGATKVTPEQRFRADSRQQLVSGARSDAEFARRLKDGDDGVTRRNGVLEKAGGGARAAAETAWSKVAKVDPGAAIRALNAAPNVEAAERRLVHATKPARPDPDAEAIGAMREQARSVACDTITDPRVIITKRCQAKPGEPCVDLEGHDFEYGVHASRARAAGLPPYPSAAELNAGMRPVRVEEKCPGPCLGGGIVSRGDVTAPCPRCHGSGKVAAWRWEVPMSKADVDAVEAEMRGCGMKRGRDYTRSGNVLAPIARPKPDGDPGEERPARDLAPCPACGAPTGSPCRVFGEAPMLFGVHAARARAAGLAGVPTPPKAPTNGVRKLAPVAGPPVLQAWARLPWAEVHVQRSCGLEVGAHEPGQCAAHGCDYEDTKRVHPLTREPRRDGADPPRGIRYKVPAEHAARFGPEVVLTRRPHVDASGEACWLYA